MPIEDDLVRDAFILGRSPREPELLLKSAALLATFGLITDGGAGRRSAR